MMFNTTKLSNALKILNWNQHSESSYLSTSLLENAHQEIELSDYLRAPSPDNESPTGFLNGESVNVEAIEDLDLFFGRIYRYYCEKGLWCITIKWVVELLSLSFTICFSAFFLLFVDWNGLRHAKCGMDAVESGIKPCDLSKEAIHEHPLTPFTLSKAVIVGYLGMLCLFTVVVFLSFLAQFKETLRIRRFYNDSLHLTDKEIQTMPWASVLEKVVQLQNSKKLCVVKDLSAHDIIMRLMRKENYLIGMLNKGVLALPISKWVPGVGPAVKFNGSKCRLVLTKTLEIIISRFLLEGLFDSNFRLKRDFVSNPKALKKTLVIVGILMLVLSPCFIIFMLVYHFLRHAEQFYNHPSTASSRRWSNLSNWIFREFNEVDHLFKHRMNSSVVHASDYLKQFPSPIVSVIAKFISFVSGGFAAILIIIAVLDESLLEGHIFGRNLLWYAAVFGTITAISRAAVADELLVLDPRGAMSMVIQQTHYMPKKWRGNENTDVVRVEFETLFQYTGIMLLEEISSIFLAPYLLIFVVPKRVDDILQFICDFTVDIEGVGNVCSFSVFDFEKHGNSNYGSPYSAPRIQRSSQGKMEKSFLSFHSTYPSWEPDELGKQFLTTIETFKDQKLQHWNPNQTHQQGVRNNSRTRRIGDPLSSMWPTDTEPKNYPYILDWYHTSGPRHTTSSNIQRNPSFDDIDHRSFNFDDINWRNPNFSYINQRNPNFQDIPEDTPLDQNWPHHFGDRSQSLEASTSVPFLQRSFILNHHDSEDTMADASRSKWWDRTAKAEGPSESFMDPPNFNPKNDDFYQDYTSERSNDEHEVQLKFRSDLSNTLSRTFYMDDLEGGSGGGGEFDPPFSDIYSKD